MALDFRMPSFDKWHQETYFGDASLMLRLASPAAMTLDVHTKVITINGLARGRKNLFVKCDGLLDVVDLARKVASSFCGGINALLC